MRLHRLRTTTLKLLRDNVAFLVIGLALTALIAVPLVYALAL
jgi:hypothetical protein